MSNELCWLSPEVIGFRAVADPPLSPHQIRVRTLLSRIRHGSDLVRCSGPQECTYPKVFQSWGVAEIVEIGEAVIGFQVGDRVYGPMLHADRQVVDAAQMISMTQFSNRAEFATFIDVGIVALRGIHASGLRFGDRIALWGMGTVGLMALQYALMSGAREISAIDPIDSRLHVAQNLGSHRIYPSWEDDNRPVNVAVDCSGSCEALMQAIRAVVPGGTLVTGAWGYDPDILRSIRERALDREIRWISIPPEPDESDLLDFQDRVQYSIITKRVVVWPIISHYFPFQDAPVVCTQIQSNPNEYIQVLFNY